MSQIQKKFIGQNSVGGLQILLENATPLRGRNALGNGDINILSVGADDRITFGLLKFPITLGANGQVLTSDGAGSLSWQDLPTKVSQLQNDTGYITSASVIINAIIFG